MRTAHASETSSSSQVACRYRSIVVIGQLSVYSICQWIIKTGMLCRVTLCYYLCAGGRLDHAKVQREGRSTKTYYWIRASDGQRRPDSRSRNWTMNIPMKDQNLCLGLYHRVVCRLFTIPLCRSSYRSCVRCLMSVYIPGVSLNK